MKRMPVADRSTRLAFSLVSQIDGLLFKTKGTGARLERDVLARCGKDAFCEVWGMPNWMSAGSFCGFYFADARFMPHVIATVASHRGYGVFVVPQMPDMKPAIAVRRSTGANSGRWVRYPWFGYLMGFAEMVFRLPEDAFKDTSGRYVRGHSMLAVFANFGDNGHFKARPRRERQFHLQYLVCPPAGARRAQAERAAESPNNGVSIMGGASPVI